MRMGSRVAVTMLVLVGLGASSHAMLTIDWGYSANLNNAGKGTFNAGWLVQMYRDVNKDSVLNSPTAFNPDGSFADGTGMSDDVMLSSWTTTLVSGKAGVNWGIMAVSGDDLKGFDCYTVIWNAPSLASASQGIIVDSTPWSFPNTDGYSSYVRSSVAGDWLPVPEPTTFALMGVGAAMLGFRKLVKKS